MKKLILPLALLYIIALASCHDQESDMPHMQQLQDSISAKYPTAQAIHINPEDGENLIVVLGDTHLYTAPADQQHAEAIQIGNMALTIFGKETILKKGKLVVTKDIHNTSNEPADGITTAINLDSLKKTRGWK